jgi:hypothetical protein
MIIGAITLMLADSTLTNLVGRNKATDTYKIYPIACPQEELIPYITCGLTSADPIACKGVGGQPEDETFDVIVWDEDYSRLDAIGRQVIEVLNNALGVAGPVTFKQLTFITHRDALDDRSKRMVRIVTFRGSIDPMIIT